MSWSKCCYLYHKEKEGRFLGNSREGELIAHYKDAPLTVNFFLPEGRYGVSRIQACTMLELEGAYELMVGARSKKAVAGLRALLSSDFDHELQRRVSSNREGFTKRVMADKNLQKALNAAPQYVVKVYPGPEGTHMLKAYCLSPESPGSDWPVCAVDDDYNTTVTNADEIRSEFFPEMDKLLELMKAARDALMNWKM